MRAHSLAKKEKFLKEEIEYRARDITLLSIQSLRCARAREVNIINHNIILS